MTEDQLRELFGEMRDEPVPADSLRRVRVAVARRTERRSRAWWWSAAVLGAAASALVLWMWRPAAAPVLKPAPVMVARETPKPAETPPAPAAVRPKPQRIRRAAAPRRAQVAGAPASSANIVIRIETPDPDVVILLIGD